MTAHNGPSERCEQEGFVIRFVESDLTFREFTLDHQNVEADKILAKGQYYPTMDYRLIQLTFPGTKSWADNETVCLNVHEPTYFIAGESGLLFTFAINDIQHELPFSEVSEPQLRYLAKIPDNMDLKQEKTEEVDRILTETDIVSLKGSGVEKFYQKPKEPRDTKVTVYLDDQQEYKLLPRVYTFNEIVELLKINSGYAVSYRNPNGPLTKFKENESVEVIDGMKFISYPPSGGSSKPSPEEQLEEIKRLWPEAYLVEEQKVVLPNTKLKTNAGEVVQTLLFMPFGDSSYSNRLFFETQLNDCETMNWNKHTIINKNWHAPSYQARQNQSWRNQILEHIHMVLQ